MATILSGHRPPSPVNHLHRLAFQTKSSADQIPTQSSDSNSNDGDNGMSDGFFSPSGSPPLILAFLAIGLFSIAMIAVFGWRRYHIGRGHHFMFGHPASAGSGLGGVGGGYRHLGEKPKLVDLWTDYTAVRSTFDAAVMDIHWAQIVPFSAIKITPTRSRSETQIGKSDSPGGGGTIATPVPARGVRERLYNRFGLRWQAPEGQLRPRGSHEMKARDNCGEEQIEENRLLQVAVCIAMPSQKRLESQRLAYSIGLSQMPWPSENERT